ncbi:MAG TPA: rod shape-determining protein RodA [Betaproteobacteria bacterium]|jgi:rod shape determining protein RodA|nr:rod shape-determining protein RodA [Burkholderiales bacterium]HBZ18402.1 rod shape-determining protein RodA [Betaproteobacteria bacterium]
MAIFHWIKTELTKTLDGPLVALIFTLFVISLGMLYSSSQGDVGAVLTQANHFAIALVLMWVVAKAPLEYLSRLALPLYLFAVVLLILTALIGEESKGAQRWLDLQVIRIQPSELLKIALPLMLAWYFDRYERVLRPINYLVAALLLLVPVALILRQPDLGTAILVFASGFFVLFFAGMSIRIFGFIATLALLVMPFAWGLLHAYQQRRILMLLNPSADPLGAGYHSIQSTIAIGSGGFLGKGWMDGTQSQLNFLPEGTTDFIFAVIGEEFGFVGVLLIFLVYALLIWRGLKIAAQAPSLFSRLAAISITMTFFIYVFVNVGMVIGLLPIVGVPLPLVSFGGSSAATVLLGMGVLMNFRANRRIVQT